MTRRRLVFRAVGRSADPGHGPPPAGNDRRGHPEETSHPSGKSSIGWSRAASTKRPSGPTKILPNYRTRQGGRGVSRCRQSATYLVELRPDLLGRHRRLPHQRAADGRGFPPRPPARPSAATRVHVRSGGHGRTTLYRVTEPYGVPVRSGDGFDSTSNKHRLGEIWARATPPVCVLRIGDYVAFRPIHAHRPA